MVYAGSAQTPTRTIRWGTADTPKGTYGNYYEDGKLITEYKDANIAFSLTIHPDIDKKYIGFWIIVENSSATAFDLSGDDFDLRFSDKPDILRPAPVEQVAKDIEGRGKWRLMFAGALAGLARRQSTAIVNDGQGNVSTVTISEPDRRAQANVQNAQSQNASGNAVKAAALKDIALKLNTLFPKTIVDGVVFFKKPDKLPPGLVFSFIANGTRYEIPFGSERTKNDQK